MDLSDGQLLLHNYKFLETIGKGSYGEVWLCEHNEDKRQYVIKKIDITKSSYTERKAAKLECQLLSELRHPNIVPYKDSFEFSEYLYIAMGYCEGGDLYTKLRLQNGVLLKERQFVEWDLKTQNIFLTKINIIKVGDLGIARVLESSNAMATTMIGTPYYMSPELFANKPYNHKSDIWALGCILYEMATLRHAFNAKSFNALSFKILSGKIPDMPNQYSYELINIMRKMLHQQPEKRPSARRVLANTYIRKNIELFLEATNLKNISENNYPNSINKNIQNSFCECVRPTSPFYTIDENDVQLKKLHIANDIDNIDTPIKNLMVSDKSNIQVIGSNLEVPTYDFGHIHISQIDQNTTESKANNLSPIVDQETDCPKHIVPTLSSFEILRNPHQLPKKSGSAARIRRRLHRRMTEALNQSPNTSPFLSESEFACSISNQRDLGGNLVDLVPKSHSSHSSNYQFQVLPVPMLPDLYQHRKRAVSASVLDNQSDQLSMQLAKHCESNDCPNSMKSYGLSDRGYSSAITSSLSLCTPKSSREDIHLYQKIEFPGHFSSSSLPLVSLESDKLLELGCIALPILQMNSKKDQDICAKNSEYNDWKHGEVIQSYINAINKNHSSSVYDLQYFNPKTNSTAKRFFEINDECDPSIFGIEDSGPIEQKEETISRSAFLKQRFLDLYKECLQVVGLTKLHEVYQILDEDLSFTKQELKIKNILGRDVYIEFMGKIWQLKLFDQNTFSV